MRASWAMRGLTNWLKRVQTGPELILGLSYSMIRRAIGDWMERKHIECWKSGKDCKHSKVFIEGPQQGRSTKLLNKSRQQLSFVYQSNTRKKYKLYECNEM